MDSANKKIFNYSMAEQGETGTVIFFCNRSKETDGFSIVQMYGFGVGYFGKSRHGNDIAKVDDDESAAAFDFNIADIDLEVRRNIQQFRVIGK